MHESDHFYWSSVNMTMLTELWAISMMFLFWTLLIDSFIIDVISEGKDLRMGEVWQETMMWHMQEKIWNQSWNSILQESLQGSAFALTSLDALNLQGKNRKKKVHGLRG